MKVESVKNPCHHLIFSPELQQGEVEIVSLVYLRTWDLRESPVIINKQTFPHAWE